MSVDLYVFCISMPFTGRYNLSTMSAFLLLAVLNTVVIFRGCFAKQVYYVTPRSDTVCPSTTSSATCQTLMHYASRSHYYFQSDTTFYFLSGTHWLMTEEPLTILAIHRLLMIGDSQLVPSSQSFISLEPSAVNSSGGGIVHVWDCGVLADSKPLVCTLWYEFIQGC